MQGVGFLVFRLLEWNSFNQPRVDGLGSYDDDDDLNKS